MKRLYYSVLFICISIFTFNCQKEISYNGPGIGNNGKAPIAATLQGNIVDENGQPVAGVQVKAGAKSATTNAKGYFRIVDAPLDKNASLVIAEKTGYFKSYRSFNATSGVNYIKIKLIPRVSAGTINAINGGNVVLSNGAKISLPANSVVKAAGGTAYAGDIHLYAAYIDPTAPDISETVPGSFLADDKDNNRVVLTSYGMLAVELESAAGEKLQIAPGSKAVLTAPIPVSIQSSAPATIALWYMDEATGIWKEDGVATKSGNNYVGEVTHFSFWNYDISSSAVTLSVTVKNSEGVPLTHVAVRLTRSANVCWNTTFEYTDSLGQASGWVPDNESLFLELVDPCDNVVYTQHIGPFTQNTNLGVITLANAASQSLLIIKGKLKNCSNGPVTNGYALINFENISRYVAANTAGEFSLTFFRCPGSPGTAEIIGVDASAQQQGSLLTVAVGTSGVTDAGDVIACGVSSTQYVNYTIDGTNYSISGSSANDSLVAYTNATQTTPPLATSVNAWQMTTNDNISFTFTHSAAAGTYAVSNLSVQNFGSLIVVQPFNVVLTNYPASVGGFYEGTFSGQFKETSTPLPIHNINGSFRLRRLN